VNTHTCRACNRTHADWTTDGIQHDGCPEIPGGECISLRTCKHCNSTMSDKIDCPQHDRTCAIEVTLEVMP